MTDIVWVLQRHKSGPQWMGGDLEAWERGTDPAAAPTSYSCKTLEDELREVKVPGDSAIPEGVFELEERDSPSLGSGAIYIKGVPNFSDVYIHSGMNERHTRGCPLVGDRLDEKLGQISGGLARGVLDRLKGMLRRSKAAGHRVFLHVRNAPGDHFVDSGRPATAAA